MMILGYFSMLGLIPAIAMGQKASPEVVRAVDLQRYAGKWYEIARYPNRFQKSCWGDVTAEYELRSDGKVNVTNRCRKDSGDGPIRSFEAVASVVDQATKAKLKLRGSIPYLPFIPISFGDYWILSLAPDYRYAVVGGPDPNYLWILSRTPKLAASDYEAVLQQLTQKGYEVSKLMKTRQQGNWAMQAADQSNIP